MKRFGSPTHVNIYIMHFIPEDSGRYHLLTHVWGVDNDRSPPGSSLHLLAFSSLFLELPPGVVLNLSMGPHYF